MHTDLETQYISTMQAADALGVSISTVKRWVDDGILPAHRTAGGHRKLLRAEVLAVARQGAFPTRDLAGLSLPSFGEEPLDLPAISAALFTALLQGHGIEVSCADPSRYHAGVAIETLADSVIAPAMGRLGHDWETARIDVWQEHRGTQLCAAALYDLKDELEARAERRRPVAIGGAPESDPYLLATLLAQLSLLDAGWAAVNLGPNTPLESLAKVNARASTTADLAVRLLSEEFCRVRPFVPGAL